MTRAHSTRQRFNTRLFKAVHRHNLIYNTCWEDPRIDRVALQLKPDDVLLTITSAGCNALDYALQGPRKVIAVDLNPRQNALLELKMAGIRRLDFERPRAGRRAVPDDVRHALRVHGHIRIGAT